VAVGTNITSVGSLALNTILNVTGGVYLGYCAGQGLGTTQDRLLAIQYGLATPLISGKFATGVAGVNVKPADIKAYWHVRGGDSGGAVPNAGADELFIEASGNGGLTIGTPNNAFGEINFADTDDNNVGRIWYDHSTDTLQLGAADAIRLTLGAASASLTVPLMVSPGSSVTPATNGQVTFELTSNTTLTFKAKGSDGTVRSGTVTLA
jgi:hypothetical protein